uniref:Elongation of very long chain fatty acids protein n=1 Tax=Syphacia muris TaxID=451379 RepID=A0A0N5AI63_9BILA
MKDRKAFDLRKVLFCWNMLISLGIVVAFVRFTEDFSDSFFNEGLYVSLCYSVDPYGVAAFYASFYGILKIVELGDTFFIVFRKRRLTFLHWFHHASALVYVFHCGAEHTGSGRIFMVMNCFVHALLYPYFAMKSLGYQMPRIIPILLTSIQIFQLFIGVLVIGYVINVKLEASLPAIRE